MNDQNKSEGAVIELENRDGAAPFKDDIDIESQNFNN